MSEKSELYLGNSSGDSKILVRYMMRKAAQNITSISQTVENKAASARERMSYTVFRTGYILIL